MPIFQREVHVECLKKPQKKDHGGDKRSLRSYQRVRCTQNLFRSPDVVSGKCLLASGRSFLSVEIFDAIPHPEPFPLYLHAWWHQFVERLLPDIYVLFFILGCFIPIDITSVRRGYTYPSIRYFSNYHWTV